MAENDNPMPEYMCSGSHGPFVDTILLMLGTWFGTHFPETSGISLDHQFKSMGVATMISFQEIAGVEPTGHFDEATRNKFVDWFGFTMDELASFHPGVTTFVQPDNSEIVWSNLPVRSNVIL